MKWSTSRSEPPPPPPPTFRYIPNGPSKRYPGDIPPGITVPRWAFFNVTVRSLHKPANCTLTLSGGVGR